MFYNPTTKKAVISDHAEFDERYFTGLRAPPRLGAPLVPHPSIDLTVRPTENEGYPAVYSGPDFRGDSEDDNDLPYPAPKQTYALPTPAIPAPSVIMPPGHASAPLAPVAPPVVPAPAPATHFHPHSSRTAPSNWEWAIPAKTAHKQTSKSHQFGIIS